MFILFCENILTTSNLHSATNCGGLWFLCRRTSSRVWGVALKERIHFLTISYGSMVEVMCQLDISQSLGYITEEELKTAEEISDRLGRVLSGLRKSLIDKLSNKHQYKPGE